MVFSPKLRYLLTKTCSGRRRAGETKPSHQPPAKVLWYSRRNDERIHLCRGVALGPSAAHARGLASDVVS